MTSHHYHAVIWIDHREARVFHFSPTDVERLVVHPESSDAALLNVRDPHTPVWKLLDDLAQLVRHGQKPEVLGQLDAVYAAALLEEVSANDRQALHLHQSLRRASRRKL